MYFNREEPPNGSLNKPLLLLPRRLFLQKTDQCGKTMVYFHSGPPRDTLLGLWKKKRIGPGNGQGRPLVRLDFCRSLGSCLDPYCACERFCVFSPFSARLCNWSAKTTLALNNDPVGYAGYSLRRGSRAGSFPKHWP